MPKFSFTTMGTPQWDGPTVIKNAKAMGYAGVDLRVSDHLGELHPNSKVEEIRELKECFSNEGLSPAGLLCYNKVGHVDSGSWMEMNDSIMRHMEIGLELGAEQIRIFGGPIHEHPSVDEFIDCTAEVLSRVLERYGDSIGVVLQNHKGSYTFLQGVELCRRLNDPRFGMVYSPDHCAMMHEDLDECHRLAREFSHQLYLSDVKFTKADRSESRPCLPGKGDVDLKAAYETLGGDDFEGWVSFKWEKIWNDFLEEPEEALPYFLKYVQSGW